MLKLLLPLLLVAGCTLGLTNSDFEGKSGSARKAPLIDCKAAPLQARCVHEYPGASADRY